MENKKVTILEATQQWVGEFNAISQSVVSRLMDYEMENWGELTKATVGDSVYVYCNGLNLETEELEHISGIFEIVSVNEEDETYTILVDGEEYDVICYEVDVQRNSLLPMWGTMWTFGSGLDEDWVRHNLQTVSDLGFRIYQDYETDDIYIGIDGCGYDFYEAHWIPLYKARGLQWHTVE